jgi:hypothetical protein
MLKEQVHREHTRFAAVQDNGGSILDPLTANQRAVAARQAEAFVGKDLPQYRTQSLVGLIYTRQSPILNVGRQQAQHAGIQGVSAALTMKQQNLQTSFHQFQRCKRTHELFAAPASVQKQQGCRRDTNRPEQGQLQSGSLHCAAMDDENLQTEFEQGNCRRHDGRLCLIWMDHDALVSAHRTSFRTNLQL